MPTRPTLDAGRHLPAYIIPSYTNGVSAAAHLAFVTGGSGRMASEEAPLDPAAQAAALLDSAKRLGPKDKEQRGKLVEE